MYHLTPKSISRYLLWAGPGVLALWALLSPALGPVLDHHFPERHHNHSHIYFGPPDADHIHPYQDHHAHSLIHWANSPDAPSAPNLPKDTVYLAPLDGMGQDSLAPLTSAAQTMNSLPDQGDPSIFSVWPQRVNPLEEAHVPLPKRPPRT